MHLLTSQTGQKKGIEVNKVAEYSEVINWLRACVSGNR